MKKIVAILVVCLLVPACITVRQSGAHDFEIVTNGNGNKFEAHTERQNSAQDAKSDPRLDASPKTDLTIPVIP